MRSLDHSSHSRKHDRAWPSVLAVEGRAAVKVEACYDRATGGRGSMVVSFSSREAADRAREGQWHGLELSRAYSNRCKSSALVKVLRWWRERAVLEGVEGKRAKMSHDSEG